MNKRLAKPMTGCEPPFDRKFRRVKVSVNFQRLSAIARQWNASRLRAVWKCITPRRLKKHGGGQTVG